MSKSEIAQLKAVFQEAGGHIKDVLSAFNTVQTKLGSMKEIGPQHQLYDDWAERFEAFQKCLRKSRNTANHMQTRMKTGRLTLVQITVDNNLDNLKMADTVEKYADSYRDMAWEATDTSREIDHRLDAVYEFADSFEQFDKPESADVRTITAQIEKIEDGLRHLRDTWLFIDTACVGLEQAHSVLAPVVDSSQLFREGMQDSSGLFELVTDGLGAYAISVPNT